MMNSDRRVKEGGKELFWADQKTDEIVSRKQYRYLEKDIEPFSEYVVKTSASISGVLHIGRLSDTIRGESAVRALLDKGHKASLIWVAEDMDPLRKIPEGVPAEFSEHIGRPVTDIPDPWGCHKSYAEHHVEKYLKVLHEFVGVPMTRYSMMEEYRKGSFKPYIKKLLENLEAVIEIQNRYRDKNNPLRKGWAPWTPVCKNCGKIITPRVHDFTEEGRLPYTCSDYKFESTTAAGCGHEDEADPLRDEGKLMWKGEWAAQWALWNVCSEGAGKEYAVPNSAFFVNGELCERVLGYPMPVPIFYEHLMIDGKKMSASVGNVVYPTDWLEVAPAELLRFLYNKKLMKTRNFSWSELPKLYDEYDRTAAGYWSGRLEPTQKRLFEISQIGDVKPALGISFSMVAFLSKIFVDDASFIRSVERTGHFSSEVSDLVIDRLGKARLWAEKYGVGIPSLAEDSKGVRLSGDQSLFLCGLADFLEAGEHSEEEIQAEIYSLSKSIGLSTRDAFKAVYLTVLGEERGPRASTLIAALDRNWVVERFKYNYK
ncbi:lysine--tRNA ligase [archaeon BMS3Abin16]|nr:lysine--tRNA ligase [archaeon BMS3Abin16]